MQLCLQGKIKCEKKLVSFTAINIQGNACIFAFSIYEIIKRF